MLNNPVKARLQNNQPSEEDFVFSEELNSEFLTKTYGQNLAFGKKMFAIFLKSMDQDIEDLKSNLAQANFEGIRSVSHKIKNNFTWVGLPQLSSLMYKLELAASNSDPSVEKLYSEIENKFVVGLMNVKKEYERLTAYLA